MAKGKPGFFARLFRKWRQRDDFEPSLAHALAATVRNALARVVGREMPALGEPFPLDEVIDDLQRRSPGWTTFFFQETDAPCLAIVMPDDWLKSIAPEGKEIASMASIASMICDGAADFLSFPAPASSLRFQDRYGQADLPALSWRFSATAPYRILTGGREGPPIFAFVNEQAARGLETALQSKQGQEALRAFLRGSPPRVPVEAPKTLKVQSPRELFLAHLFLPPRAECGKQVLQTSCTALAVTEGGQVPRDAPGVWVAAECQLAGAEAAAGAGPARRLAHWFFFPCADADRATRVRETCREIAGCLFRGALPALGLGPGRRSGKAPAGAGFPPGPGQPFPLSSAQRGGASSVGAPARRGLHRHRRPGAAAPTALRCGGHHGNGQKLRRALPLALALNHRLLAGGLPSLPRSFHDRRLGEEFFPFSGFADLITERDLSLILQNYLPHALGGLRLRQLYCWQAEDIVTPYLFDEEKLSRHMTPQMRDAWQRPVQGLGSLDDYLERNREALISMEKASRRRVLLLSPRARHLLSDLIAPPLRARARRRLEETAASGVPFATLRSMGAPLLQRFLATRSDRAICLAVVGSEAELPFIRKNVSAARASRLEEDLLMTRKQLEAGDLEWGEALRARTEMAKAAKNMLESASNQEHRGGAGRR